MQRVLIVPAAGLGTRLKATLPKVLVPVGGRPMLDHLLERFAPWAATTIVIANPAFARLVRGHLDTVSSARDPHVAEQPQPTGMLDAILAAAPDVRASDAERIWIAWCDQVGILPGTLDRLAAEDERTHAPLVFPTVEQDAPYIHFPRDAAGRITGVLQRREGDAMPPRGESDMGLFSLSREAYLDALPRFAAEAAPGTGTRERNFLPFIPWLAARADVRTIPATDPREAVGINTPEELRIMEAWLLSRAAHS